MELAQAVQFADLGWLGLGRLTMPKITSFLRSNSLAAVFLVEVRRWRSLFRRTFNSLAPSLPQASPEIKMDRRLPKIIVGLLSSPSGLGQSARLAAAALRKEGFSVLGIDVSRFFPAHSGYLLSCDLPDGRGYRGAAHVHKQVCDQRS